MIGGKHEKNISMSSTMTGIRGSMPQTLTAFLNSVRSKFKAGPAPSTSNNDEKSRKLIYAIGDIHGRNDLLRRLMDLIEKDLALVDENKIDSTRLVFLGDYIDRGYESFEVIETLIKLRKNSWDVVFLKGNHEEALLSFIDDPTFGQRWMKFGGRETLMSYDVEVPEIMTEDSDFEGFCREFCKNLPKSHLEFLENLRSYEIIDRYMFVHAGVDPLKPVEEQTDAEYLWIRDRFLQSVRRLPYIIVHGHTPETRPVWDGRRIGIDTGAYISNNLTAVRIFSEDITFLST